MNKQKFVALTPNKIIAALMVFIVLVTVGFAFGPKVTALVTAPSSAEAAARAGAEAFLSTDYEKGQSAWENAVCAVSSDDGCKVLKTSYSPMVWPQVAAGSVRQFCQAASAKRTNDTPAAEGVEAYQVWQVSLSCTDPDGNKTSGDVNVVVVENATSGWKFERLAFSEEGAK